MRIIPEDNLAYPVLIEIEGWFSGSWFQLNTWNSLYFITAKHVIFEIESTKLKWGIAQLTCQTKDISDESVTIYSLDLRAIFSESNICYHETKDVAAIKIWDCLVQDDWSYIVNLINGVNLTKTWVSDLVSVDIKNTLYINEVLIGNDIFLYGYPSSLGLRNSPQFDYQKPLLRKWIVASINPREWTIILDCPVYYGNSWWPVVQVSYWIWKIKHDIIGVVSQFIPYTENWENKSNGLIHTEISNSWYSVVVWMDAVFQLLWIKK